MKPATKYTVGFWSLLILSAVTTHPLASFISVGLALVLWLCEYFEEKYEDY